MLSTGKIIFSAGIVIIVLTVIAVPICFRALKKAEKSVNESIWNDYR